MMFRSFILISIAIVASGCAATGKNFTEHQSLLNKVGENQSRIYVYRTGESTLYSGESATVKIDNVKKGKCDYKGFNVFDVPSGNHQLQVNAWDMPGTCTIATNFDPQSEHYFEIKPRLTNYVKILNFFNLLPLGNLLPEPLMAAGATGAGVSATGICGPFSIEEVESNLALKKIKILNQTQ